MLPDSPSDGTLLPVLHGALNEANNSVRAYDTKAQIAAVGYIFSLGIAGQILNYIDQNITLSGLKVAMTWIVFMVPILQFGMVLYPSRGGLKTARKGVLFTRGQEETTLQEFTGTARSCDLVDELSRELLRVSNLREIKRRRFTRGMLLTMCAYATLFLYQVVSASLPVSQ